MGPRGPGGEPVLHRASPGLTLERALALISGAAPGVDLRDAVAVEGGWDYFVVETGAWIFRFPRRSEVEQTLRTEIRLLPVLGPALPVEVPQPALVFERPTFFAGYRKVAGAALTHERQTEHAGRELGRFLEALHAFPVGPALAAGVPGGGVPAWRLRQEELVDELEARVGPLLSPRERAAGRAAFDDFLGDDASFDFEPVLVHYDLGPTHVLAREDGSLQGVIDWSDARVGDPAADFAWVLHGAAPAFARAVETAYGPMSSSIRRRALHYHRLGPWHEVVHGQETGDDSWIASGLAGVTARLPEARDGEPRAGR